MAEGGWVWKCTLL